MTAIQPLDRKHGEALVQATLDVLSQMVMLEPESHEAVNESKSVLDDEVIGTLGFTGSHSGIAIVTSNMALARQFCANMLMMDESEISDDAEVSDSFGEVVNMIVGNFKNAWVEDGNVMDLAVPSVSFGETIRVSTRRELVTGYSALFRFERGELRVEVRFHE